ncbi:MAG: GAF domain-containing protein [Melioribacteraceae bacterium]|nr:MAG: GAF domain-containing protein [Melioribacteraceae bacterium]
MEFEIKDGIENYEELLPQVEAILNKEEPVITNLSNFTALLKQSFKKISWVGFYFFDGEKLVLGPFQGKVACTIIKMGKGVCGTSAQKRETVIVENVHEFPGHIACDGGSNSEIVVPIISNDNLIGVLDLDSYEFSAFNENDKIYLEKMCRQLLDKLPLENYSIF